MIFNEYYVVFQCSKKSFALWIDKFFRWFFCLILKYVWIRMWMYSTKISSYCRYIRYILWLTIVTTFLFIFKAHWNSSVVHEWWGCSPLQFNHWPNVIGIGQAKQYFPWYLDVEFQKWPGRVILLVILGKVKTYNLFVTSKNETTNSPIHQFSNLMCCKMSLQCKSKA